MENTSELHNYVRRGFRRGARLLIYVGGLILLFFGFYLPIALPLAAFTLVYIGGCGSHTGHARRLTGHPAASSTT